MKRNRLLHAAVWICVIVLSAAGLTSVLHNVTMAAEPEPDAVMEKLQSEVVPENAVRADAYFRYENAPLAMQESPYFVGGRLYVARDGFSRALARQETPAEWKHSLPWCSIGGETYISLNDAAETLGLWPVFDTDAREITLCRAMPRRAPAEMAAGAAYLRLEDIVADYGISGRFDDTGLEQLRAQADYLYRNGASYYIAWIPVYVNPQEGIINDLTRNYSFYNAQFLYTLDYMVGHGGILVAHGLTHQHGDEISADGTEFGEASPFDDTEMRRRMEEIRTIADTLGYQVDAFEFPHYASTLAQERIAAQYFRVIYQQDRQKQPFGRVERENVSGQQVIYVPTPQDYVRSEERGQEMLAAIRRTPQGQLVSLFFHPSLDRSRLTLATTADGVRVYSYSADGFLPQLITLLRAKGLALSALT
ncbi:MAG: DUF2334 domain-containing protein [Intestinibacillus sp.]